MKQSLMHELYIHICTYTHARINPSLIHEYTYTHLHIYTCTYEPIYLDCCVRKQRHGARAFQKI